MLALEKNESALRRALQDCLTRAKEQAAPRWFSLRAPVESRDALALFTHASKDEAFYWEQPQQAHALVAHGGVLAIQTRGADRFRDASRRSRAFLNLFQDRTRSLVLVQLCMNGGEADAASEFTGRIPDRLVPFDRLSKIGFRPFAAQTCLAGSDRV